MARDCVSNYRERREHRINDFNKDYSPDQERDENGRFADMGGSEASRERQKENAEKENMREPRMNEKELKDTIERAMSARSTIEGFGHDEMHGAKLSDEDKKIMDDASKTYSALSGKVVDHFVREKENELKQAFEKEPHMKESKFSDVFNNGMTPLKAGMVLPKDEQKKYDNEMRKLYDQYKEMTRPDRKSIMKQFRDRGR